MILAPHPRLASADDIDAVESLLRACIAGMRARGLDQWDEVYPTRAVFEADARARTLFIEDQPAAPGLIATLVLNDRQDPEYDAVPWTFASERVAVIHRLMVHPSAQRRGIARALMTFAEDEAFRRGFDVIRLDAFTANARALELYDRLG